jgi:hypothetical protein
MGVPAPVPAGTSTEAAPDPVGQLRTAPAPASIETAPPAEGVSPADAADAAPEQPPEETDPLAVAEVPPTAVLEEVVPAAADVVESEAAEQAGAPKPDAATAPDGFTPLDDPNWTAHLPIPRLASVPTPVATEVPVDEPADELSEAGVAEPAEEPADEPVDTQPADAPEPDTTDSVDPAEPESDAPVQPVDADAAPDAEPVALVLPTSLVAPREAAHHPHPQATHAAAAITPSRPAPQSPPTAPPRDDPEAVEFRSGETPRRLLGAAFVVAAVSSVLAIFAAVDTGTGSALLLSGVLVAASLVLWWALVSWSPTVVSVRNGTLEIGRGAGTKTYDLSDPDTTVEVRGDVRSPAWRAVVTDGSRRVVLNRRQVRPARFTEIVEHHGTGRPD